LQVRVLPGPPLPNFPIDFAAYPSFPHCGEFLKRRLEIYDLSSKSRAR
jgi:hypothetical protein